MTGDCAHITGARFCSNCGKDLRPDAINLRTVLGELTENWWEKGVLHTLLGLLLHPGQLIRRYIETDRDLLVRPIPYVAVALAFSYAVRTRLLPESVETDLGIIEMLRREPVLLPLISALLSSLALHFIFYRRSPIGLFGTMVMRLYVLAQSTLLVLAADLLMELVTTERSVGRNLSRIAFGLGFTVFAVRQYYAAEGRGGLFRATLAIFCGEITLILLIFIPAALIDEAGWL